MMQEKFEKRSGVRLLAAAFLLMITPAAWAQVESGRIAGTVTDASGAVIPGVEVQIINVDTNRAVATTTDATGRYSSVPLPVGVYRAEAQTTGFKRAVQTGIRLQVQETAVVNFTLEIGDLTEQVEVTAEVPLLQTTEASQGQVIDERRVVDLPLNGRDYVQLALLSEGAVEPIGGRAGGFSVGGVKTTKNNYMLDGFDNNSNQIAAESLRAEAVKPSVDAIQEFKVQTNAYSAEFGRAAGGVLNLNLKSGTNRFHGTAYEFLRNEELDARNFFDPGDTPPFKRNQFGFSVGGPIVRNKTFFFGSYEQLLRRESRTISSTLPTLQMRQGDFSQISDPIFDPFTFDPETETRDPFPDNQIPVSRMDPISRELINLYPDPQTPALSNNFVFNGPDSEDVDRYSIRVDHTFSTNDTISFRWVAQENDLPFAALNLPPPAFGGANSFKNTGYNTGITWNHSFTPTLFTSTRFGWNFLEGERTNPAEAVARGNFNREFGIQGVDRDSPGSFAAFNITGFRQLGIGPFNPLTSDSQNRQLINDTTWIRGRHTLKFGVNITRTQMNIDNVRRAAGVFNFDGRFTRNPATGAGGNGMADFLTGIPQQTGISTPVRLAGRAWLLAGYVQDEWRATQKLTVNLGVRYEWFRPFEDLQDGLANFDIDSDPANPRLILASDAETDSTLESDDNNFGPRIGIAYQATDNLVIRTGYGIFYPFPQPVGDSQFLIGNLPFAFTVDVLTDGLTPAFLLRDGVPPSATTLEGVTGNTPSSYERGPSLAYTQQWNFNVQYQPNPNWLFQAGYFGTKGNSLFIRIDGNPVRELGPGNPNLRRSFQELAVPGTDNIISPLGTVNRHQWSGNSNYHSLQAKVEHRFDNGFTLLGSYIFSRTISDLRGYAPGGNAAGAGFQNFLDFTQERALDNQHVKHRFVTSGIWELPFGRGRRFGSNMHPVLDGILGGWDLGGIVTLRSGQPFTITVAGDRANSTTTNRPNLAGDPESGISTIDRYFNVDAFAPNNLFQFGNVGRNTMTGPSFANVDFSAMKRFQLFQAWDQPVDLQFRFEAFNVFNDTNFGIPGNTLGTAPFGEIGSASTSRKLQFGLKVIF